MESKTKVTKTKVWSINLTILGDILWIENLGITEFKGMIAIIDYGKND